jgi:predicted nucleic acid-binding protein
MILLDTNVISEIMRPHPDPAVTTWIQSVPRKEFWTSSVVVAEILSGIDLMPAGRRQEGLREAVEEMIAEDFHDQILNFDLAAARHFGQILSARQRIGLPINEMDAQIAATARVYGATVATRNIRDFLACDLALVNPWSDNPQESRRRQ